MIVYNLDTKEVTIEKPSINWKKKPIDNAEQDVFDAMVYACESENLPPHMVRRVINGIVGYKKLLAYTNDGCRCAYVLNRNDFLNLDLGIVAKLRSIGPCGVKMCKVAQNKLREA